MEFYLDNSIETSATIVPVGKNEEIDNSVIGHLIEQEIFDCKAKTIYTYLDNESMKQIILVGVGEIEKLDLNKYTHILAKAAKHVKTLNIKNYGIECKLFGKFTEKQLIERVVQAATLSTYDFNKYKSDKKEEYKAKVSLVFDKSVSDELSKTLDEAIHVVDGILIARNLVNEPANVIYPESLADKVVDMANHIGVEVEVFDEHRIQELGMHALWAVGMGSDKLPRLIVMRHMGNPKSNEILGVIGKGLTYDTGGYSIKPTESMQDMKSDMGGAGAVIGLMHALVKNNVEQNVVVIVAAAENAISGHSYKPGDIINSMGGKTIEVLNTDAEGRLTLVDAVTYAIEKENVTKIIDIATLTGAVLVALGDVTTGIITNNDEFCEEFITASKLTDEKFWQLPSFEEYKEQYKGKVADLANTGGRKAGTITAGMFIGDYVKDIPWLHLDIAGTGWADRELYETITKGGTGVPIKTLYKYIVQQG